MLKTHEQFYEELLKGLESLTPEQIAEGREELLSWAKEKGAEHRQQQASARPSGNKQ